MLEIKGLQVRASPKALYCVLEQDPLSSATHEDPFQYDRKIVDWVVKKFHQGVKQIGSRSNPTFYILGYMLGLIWVQTVCKGYQQTTLIGKELNMQT